MGWLCLLFVVALMPVGAMAESLVATRTIRALSMIAPDDVTTVAALIPGALSGPEAAVGLESRVTIYAGRPILSNAVGPAATILRNQLVTIIFERGGLLIAAEGRALGRGGPGDEVQVMNLGSRATLTGRIADDGTVHVSH
jgi:flagellar basal body P-ring formation protein FlgA